MRNVVACVLAGVLGCGLLAAATASGADDAPAAKADDALAAKADDGRLFEMRTYITNPGKLEALNKRFREHTLRLFKKHGVEIVAFWTPTDGPDAKDTLVYVVAFPNEAAMKKAWADFAADPEWKKAFAASHKDGVIVKKVISQKLRAVDYSPIK
jgi:hypothetical protein